MLMRLISMSYWRPGRLGLFRMKNRSPVALLMKLPPVGTPGTAGRRSAKANNIRGAVHLVPIGTWRELLFEVPVRGRSAH